MLTVEELLFEEGDIKVSPGRLVVGPKNYVLSNVSLFHVESDPPVDPAQFRMTMYGCGTVLAGLGTVVLFAALSDPKAPGGAFCCSLALLVPGALFFIGTDPPKRKHRVILKDNNVSNLVIESTDEGLIRGVEEALGRAVDLKRN